MQIGVAATPDVAIPTLDWLLTTEHDITLVISRPDRQAGRGRELKQSPVATWAKEHQIRTIKPESALDLQGQIDHLDLIITIGFGVLLPEKILSLPRFGFLNLHFSLLPAYRGAAPAQRALQNGESVTGVTVFQLDKGMDTGAIYSQSVLQIDQSWRSFELLNALASLGPKAIETALSMIEEGVAPQAQVGKGSIAAKISKSEAEIDFSKGAEQLVNEIRAFTYEPGSWTLLRGDVFKITRAVCADIEIATPGQIVVLGKSVFVGTGDLGSIELIHVIPAGKKEMSAIDWARGARLKEGEKLG